MGVGRSEEVRNARELEGVVYSFTVHPLKARPPLVVLKGPGETMTREEATCAASHYMRSDQRVENSMMIVRHAEEGWLELFPDGQGRWQGFLPKDGKNLDDVVAREDAKSAAILGLFAREGGINPSESDV